MAVFQKDPGLDIPLLFSANFPDKTSEDKWYFYSRVSILLTPNKALKIQTVTNQANGLISIILSWLAELRLNVALNTALVISEMLISVNLSASTKHDKTKQNYNRTRKPSGLLSRL